MSEHPKSKYSLSVPGIEGASTDLREVLDDENNIANDIYRRCTRK
jgi:hypothetical protein